MKIHKIILKDYRQFKDLEVDLTYPLGHEKARQPLEKSELDGLPPEIHQFPTAFAMIQAKANQQSR